MRKTLILILLGLGTLAGYAHAFHSYRHHRCFDGPRGPHSGWMSDEARCSGWGDDGPAPRPPAPAPPAPPAP